MLRAVVRKADDRDTTWICRLDGSLWLWAGSYQRRGVVLGLPHVAVQGCFYHLCQSTRRRSKNSAWLPLIVITTKCGCSAECQIALLFWIPDIMPQALSPGRSAPWHYAPMPQSPSINNNTDKCPHITACRTWPYVHNVILRLSLLKNSTCNMTPKSQKL